MFFDIFENIGKKDKELAVASLIEHSSPRRDFFVMIILSVAMATFGLLVDSIPVLIGSMLIAPMLYPILSLSMALVISDKKLLVRSFFTLIKSVTFALVVAFLVTAFFEESGHVPFELLYAFAGNQPPLTSAVISFIAGLAASLALVKPHFNENLIGVAIAVSLIPPLAGLGVALSIFDWNLFTNAFLLFLINVAGILFASVLVFLLLNLYVARKAVSKAIKKEDRIISREQKKIKKPLKK